MIVRQSDRQVKRRPDSNSGMGRRAVPTSHGPLPAFFHDQREQQDVRLSLMVPFTMVVCNILVHCPTQTDCSLERLSAHARRTLTWFSGGRDTQQNSMNLDPRSLAFVSYPQ
jgi:hypothetical protein